MKHREWSGHLHANGDRTLNTPVDTEYEAAIVASVTETQKRVEETKASPQPPEQPPIPGLPPLTERQKQELWASAMSDVAGEFTASLIHLPPAERKLASRRAAALSSCANQLLSGDVPPRPRQGDLPMPR